MKTITKMSKDRIVLILEMLKIIILEMSFLKPGKILKRFGK